MIPDTLRRKDPQQAEAGRKSQPMRVLLIDDEPVFGNAMVQFFRKHGVEVDYYPSLMDLGHIGRIGDYSVAVVDFEIGDVNGIEIAEYLSALFGDLPMVLISQRSRHQSPDHPWPQSVQRFVHKKDGFDAIYDAALSTQALRH